MNLSGADILMKSLEKEGVEVVFGYPGGTVLFLYDALLEANFRHIMTRHEQAAAHAADAYARATGRVGVCLATSGPGATNLVTGIATAHIDSIPMVALTGQVNKDLIGRDAFQEADTCGMTIPFAKHSFLVREAGDIPAVIQEAFHLARSGRPGPVVVDLPKDITADTAPFIYPERLSARAQRTANKCAPQPRAQDIARLADALHKAKRPVLYVGGGVIAAGACASLRQLAEKTQIPVTTTLMGIGCFPGDHPLSLGMLGMHGTRYANQAVTQSDLLLAIGVRFDDRVTGRCADFAPNATIVHIDIDPAEISKNVHADLAIISDARQALAALLPLVDSGEHGEWLAQVMAWKEMHPLTYEQGRMQIKPQQVCAQLNELAAANSIVTTDVGQHQMWTAQYCQFDAPRRFLTSGGLGTMGYGLPAAIGAQIACPDRQVIAILGDGGFQMTMQELGTMVKYQLPVKIVLLNNQYLGMVRQWQELFLEKRYSAVEMDANPDFIQLAGAYGIPARRVEDPQELVECLAWCLHQPGPAFLEVKIAKEENVFPMVPAGKALHEMLGY